MVSSRAPDLSATEIKLLKAAIKAFLEHLNGEADGDAKFGLASLDSVESESVTTLRTRHASLFNGLRDFLEFMKQVGQYQHTTAYYELLGTMDFYDFASGIEKATPAPGLPP